MYGDRRIFPSPGFFIRTVSGSLWPIIFSGGSQNDALWGKHLIITKKTFGLHCGLLRKMWKHRDVRGRKENSFEFKIACTLCYLAKKGDMSAVAAKIACSIPSVSRNLSQATDILSSLAKKCIGFNLLND